MEIQIGREYNIHSQHRRKDDNTYIFRGVVLGKESNTYLVEVTAFNVSQGQRPGDHVNISPERFKSLVANTNLEAKMLLEEEW
jgi:hypothetical protein